MANDQPERFCIVTVVVGKDFTQQFQWTFPPMQSYADHLGAELIVLSGNRCPHWAIENKFRVANIIRLFDRTLFLDVDVFVRNDAPNIFDEVPVGCIGVLDELQLFNYAPWAYRYIVMDEVRQSQGMQPAKVTRSFNSGVIVFDREHAELFDPPKHPLPKHWCAEQNLLTARIEEANTPVYPLERKWNCLWNADGFMDQHSQAHFVHLNGCNPIQRIDLLKQLAANGRIG